MVVDLNNLLGLTRIIALNLIQRVNGTHRDILEQFLKVFTGLRTLGGDWTKRKQTIICSVHTLESKYPSIYEIKFKTTSTVLKFWEWSQRWMTDPTPRCAGFMAVLKKTGAVKICVDLKPLNESGLWEVHLIRRVDEALVQLTGATVLSKLDANSWFWLILPLPDPHHLTTLIGRDHFNNPFSISSALGLSQKTMSTILEGLEGVVCNSWCAGRWTR